ncbi:MAG: hypothetical protein ACKOD1_02095 [Sphingomonadales bacterium]
MRFLFVLTGLLLLQSILYGQPYGGNPARQRWKQLSTDSVRIIYAPGLDSQAQRAIALVRRIAASDSFRLGKRLQPIDIVLQQSPVISNAYVQLGPFRSEWMLMPNLNNFTSGTLGWSDLLALHEYRHVEQINNMNVGLSKAARILLGEQGYDLAINAAVPNWFFEGDATWQESALSRQGRGRLPQFLNAFPALWQGGKNYPWSKLRNGSYKDVVPDHYELGYLLVNYGVARYGEKFWPTVIQRAASFSSLFYPFQQAIAKTAQLSYAQFRKNAFAWYKEKQPLAEPSVPVWLLKTETRYATDRQYPYWVGGDTLLLQKSSRIHRPGFYLVTKNREKLLRTLDISLDQPFAYRNGKLVYAAYEKDPRWHWVSYSSLRIVDVHSGKQTSLTHHTRYFTPDIAPGLDKIIAVQVSESGKASLELLSSSNGKQMASYVSPAGYLYTDPKFLSDTSVVTAVRDQQGAMALLHLSLTTGLQELLTPFLPYSLGFLHPYQGAIYFTAGFSGNDHIYCLRLPDRSVWQVTSGGVGKYNVHAHADTLYWSEPTAEGLQVRIAPAEPRLWKRVSLDSLNLLTPYSVAGAPSGSLSLLSQFAATRSAADTVSATRYKKSTGLLNIHSWRPDYQDPLFRFALYGENVLSTLQTEIAYAYNENERSHSVGMSATYAGWFPHLTLGTDYTFERSAVVRGVRRAWSQLDTRVGLSLPLQDVNGRSYRNLNVGSFYVLRNDVYKGAYRDSLGSVTFSYLLHSIQFSLGVQQAMQHIFPRWGASVSLLGQHSVSSFDGRQFNAAATIYLPGLSQRHHLLLQGAWQERDTLGQLSFGNRLAYSRGFTGRNFSRMWKAGVNYHFPIWLPDFGIASIAYVNRVRANLFYDYTLVYSRNKRQTAMQRSTGAEVFFDTKWWNQHPVSFGFRVNYLIDRDQFDGYRGWFAEFIMPVTLF